MFHEQIIDFIIEVDELIEYHCFYDLNKNQKIVDIITDIEILERSKKRFYHTYGRFPEFDALRYELFSEYVKKEYPNWGVFLPEDPEDEEFSQCFDMCFYDLFCDYSTNFIEALNNLEFNEVIKRLRKIADIEIIKREKEYQKKQEAIKAKRKEDFMISKKHKSYFELLNRKKYDKSDKSELLSILKNFENENDRQTLLACLNTHKINASNTLLVEIEGIFGADKLSRPI
jgi:hypothetical protein